MKKLMIFNKIIEKTLGCKMSDIIDRDFPEENKNAKEFVGRRYYTKEELEKRYSNVQKLNLP